MSSLYLGEGGGLDEVGLGASNSLSSLSVNVSVELEELGGVVSGSLEDLALQTGGGRMRTKSQSMCEALKTERTVDVPFGP